MTRVSEKECISLFVSGEVVTFRWEDGTTAAAPCDVVANSTLLQALLSDATPGDDIKVTLDAGVLQQWLDCVSDEPYVLKMLKLHMQAADFLGDDSSLEDFSEQAAGWLFHGDASSTGEAAQAIEQLPVHLVEAVLSASSLTLDAQLCELPQCLHKAAVQAEFPDIAQHGCMNSQSLRDLQCTELMWPQLQTMPQLTSLSLYKKRMYSTEIEAFMQHLGSITSLRSLDLDNSCLRVTGYIGTLVSALVRLSGLQEIDVSGAAIQGNAELDALASGLSTLPLRSLHARRIGIHGENVDAFVPHLLNISTLRELSLGCNKLGHDGVRSLARGLANMPFLEVLSLPHVSSDHVKEDSISSCMVELAGHLEHCTGLLWLDLRMNLICDTEMVPLMQSLSRRPSLQRLHLAGNEISGAGIQAAMQHFMALANLQMLSLFNQYSNSITAQSLMPLVNALPLLKVVSIDDFQLRHGDHHLFRGPFYGWKLPGEEMSEHDLKMERKGANLHKFMQVSGNSEDESESDHEGEPFF